MLLLCASSGDEIVKLALASRFRMYTSFCFSMAPGAIEGTARARSRRISARAPGRRSDNRHERNRRIRQQRAY